MKTESKKEPKNYLIESANQKLDRLCQINEVKRTVEMDDNLDEYVENCKSEFLDNWKDYMKENLDVDDFDTYWQKQGGDAIHEIVDSNTPIHTKDIEDLYYLYGSEFDEAYENAGIGDGTEENHKQVTIYCYLEEQVSEYMNDTMKEYFDKYIEFRDNLEEEDKEKKEKQLIEFIDNIEKEEK
jgi:hypothetical protein